jgi:hypothetical protein
VADRSSIKSIINVLQTNLEQLINPDIDSIPLDDLELIASMCDQIVDNLKSSLFFLKRFNYHFSEDEEKEFNTILTGINKKLSLIDDMFVSDNGTVIFPLYLMVSKLGDDVISDLELYFIVFSLAYHVHQEIDRRNANPSNMIANLSSNNKVSYDLETDTFVISSNSSNAELEDKETEDGGLVLHLRDPTDHKKGFSWLDLFEKA